MKFVALRRNIVTNKFIRVINFLRESSSLGESAREFDEGLEIWWNNQQWSEIFCQPKTIEDKIWILETKPKISKDDLKKTFDVWYRKNIENLRDAFSNSNEYYTAGPKIKKTISNTSMDVIEFLQQSIICFPHIVFVLKKLGPIQNGYINLASWLEVLVG